MMLRARLALGLSAAALVAGALVTWSRAPDARPAASRAELEPTAPPSASVTPDENVGPAEEAQPEPGERRAFDDPSIKPEQQEVASFGTLRVHVRSRDTGESLERVRLSIGPAEEDHWSMTHVDGARGRPGEGPVTGADGLVEFEVPLAVDYTMRAWRGQFYDESEDAAVPAFQAPETREMVLELTTQYSLPFVGRVVAAEIDEPLPGASVSIADGFIEVTTDADGYFEALVPSVWMLHAEAQAPGYAAAFFDVRGEHASRADARVVRLHESARLDVLVLGRDGSPLEGVRVRASTDLYHVAQCTSRYECMHGGPLRWSCRTGAAGRASLADLPPNAPLSIKYEKEWSFRRAEGTPVWMVPGEDREIVYRIGSGATVAGVLVDEGQGQREEVEVWLVPGDTGTPRYFGDHERPAAWEKTDAAGKFEFTDVTDGTWLVGVAPGSPYPPLAEPVEVVGGAAQRTVFLDGNRGLRIAGRVVDPTGAPIEGAFVFATPHEWQQTSLDVSTDENGRFAIGPLAPGTFSVHASGALSGYTDSDQVRANPGDEDILLQLCVAGSLRGRLVSEATGTPIKGQVTASLVTRAEPWSGWVTTWTNEEGEFHIDGLEPGLYHVVAGTERAECARENDVSVLAGSQAAEILLEARPAATLRVRYLGSQPYGHFRAELDGAVVAADGIEKGSSSSNTVPPGTIRVDCWWAGLEEPEVHELTLAVGEEREVVFGAE